jgi:hypothetical protein
MLAKLQGKRISYFAGLFNLISHSSAIRQNSVFPWKAKKGHIDERPKTKIIMAKRDNIKLDLQKIVRFLATFWLLVGAII